MKRLLGMIVFIVLLGSIVATVTVGQWKGDGPSVSHYEAVGFVTWKGEAPAPNGPKNGVSVYLKVDFKTEDGTAFVIPFRRNDLEVIPVSATEHDEYVGGGVVCQNNLCSQANYSVQRVKATSIHGILRYHNCEGNLYCFDSFTEIKSKGDKK